MSKKSEDVKVWRNNTKKRIIESMGGKCVCCGYNKCNAALDLHQIDSSENDFSIGRIMANPVSWDTIVNELKKCVLLCNRCHMEIHYGDLELPKKYTKFNEEYSVYRNITPEYDPEPCPVCGGKKKNGYLTCSRNCAAKKSNRVDWVKINLFELLQNNSFVKVGEILGISDSAVRKRAKKIGII